jgi:hypothetical protein
MNTFRIWREADHAEEFVIDLRSTFDTFIASRPFSPGSIAEYRTLQGRLIDWALETERARRPPGPTCFLQNLGKSDIAEFCTWITKRAGQDGGNNSARTSNKRRTQLLTVMNWIEHHQPDDSEWRVPRFPPALRERSAPIADLTLKEVGRIYRAAGELPDPPAWRRDLVGPYSDQWQAAIVLMSTYGMDTGTIWKYGRNPRPLRWHQVFWQASPPSRYRRLEQVTESLGITVPGWIRYRRPKHSQLVKQRAALEVPITPQVAFQLRRLASNRPDSHPKDLIFRPAVGTRGKRPPEVFRRLCDVAGVDPALAEDTDEAIRWQCKHLRKTAGAWHEDNLTGAGDAVLGRPPRHMTEVSSDSYIRFSPLAARSLLTLTYPPEFPT